MGRTTLVFALLLACTAAAVSTHAPEKAVAKQPVTAAPQPQGEPDQPPPDTSAADTTGRAHTYFGGRWKLSMTRSVFGKVPGGKPASRTDLIEQDGPRIRQTLYLVLGSKPDTTVYVYTVDGQQRHNKVGGQDIASIARWDGDRLHIVSTTRLLLVLPMTLDERWQLGDAGRTLTYIRHVEYGIGKGDQRLLFERE
jgi:hypothetical protein